MRPTTDQGQILTFAVRGRSVPALVDVTHELVASNDGEAALALVRHDAPVAARPVDERVAPVADGRGQTALQVWGREWKRCLLNGCQ